MNKKCGFFFLLKIKNHLKLVLVLFKYTEMSEKKMQEIGKKLAVHLGERCLRSSLSWELR